MTTRAKELLAAASRLCTDAAVCTLINLAIDELQKPVLVQSQLPLNQSQHDLIDAAVSNYFASLAIGSLVTYSQICDRVQLVPSVDLVNCDNTGRPSWRRCITRILKVHCAAGRLAHAATRSHYILAKHP